jgi:hypothetical protein
VPGSSRLQPPQWGVYLKRQAGGVWHRELTTPDPSWADRRLDRALVAGRDRNERPVVSGFVAVYAWGTLPPLELQEPPREAQVKHRPVVIGKAPPRPATGA